MPTVRNNSLRIRPRLNTSGLDPRTLLAVQQPEKKLLMALLSLKKEDLMTIHANNRGCVISGGGKNTTKPELAFKVFDLIKGLDRGPFFSASELQLIRRSRCGLCEENDAFYIFSRCSHFGVCLECKLRLEAQAGPPRGVVMCPQANCGVEHRPCELWEVKFYCDNIRPAHHQENNAQEAVPMTPESAAVVEVEEENEDEDLTIPQNIGSGWA